ncbi:hypothetical protein F652_888 [Enterobacteriaceae bacterium bta3-1]|nr:hypothetical protein F652_888 [Enterobacteriaceae bacterium bta3-1]
MAWLEPLLAHFALYPAQLFLLLFSIALSKSTVALSSLLPPASVMLLASISISQPSLTVGEVWLAITLGAALGSILSFHLGVLIMRNKLFEGLLTRHEEKLQNIRRKLENNSLLVLFSSRFIAVLRYMVPLAAGMLPLNRLRVYCVSLFSAAIWAALFVGITSGALLIIPAMI